MKQSNVPFSLGKKLLGGPRRLLSQSRPMPELIETHDRVQVTVRRRILKPQVIDLIAKADQAYQLTQRERIALGLLAQHDAPTARELANTLELFCVEALQLWSSEAGQTCAGRMD